jgi:hypothetical protein
MPRKSQPPRRRPRKFAKKKKVFRPQKPLARRMKYNKEVKSIHQTVTTETVEHQTANADRMANGVVIYPAPFHRLFHEFTSGTTCDAEIIGCWLTPYALSQKFVVDWASLTHHADLNKGLELRCRYGYVKNTTHKAGVDLDADWQLNMNKMVIRELQNSGIDDNFLSYTKRSRSIAILGDFMVRPNLNKRPVVYDDNTAGVKDVRFAPPNNISINWTNKKLFSKQKRRVSPLTNAPTKHVMSASWVPFVYLCADNITANMGSLDIATSSKFYYTDS